MKTLTFKDYYGKLLVKNSNLFDWGVRKNIMYTSYFFSTIDHSIWVERVRKNQKIHIAIMLIDRPIKKWMGSIPNICNVNYPYSILFSEVL